MPVLKLTADPARPAALAAPAASSPTAGGAPATREDVAAIAEALLGMNDELRRTVVNAVRDELARHSTPAPTSDAETSAGVDMDAVRVQLQDLLSKIELTKEEVAALKPSDGTQDQIMAATGELEAVVRATEQATSDILESAEAMQGAGDRLRSGTIDAAAAADLIDGQATNIMMACSFQDITGQRINTVVNTLLYVEQGLKRIVDLWGIEQGTAETHLIRNAPDDDRPDKELLNGPQPDGHGVSQDDIDKLFA